MLAASPTAPLPEGMRAVHEVGIEGGGGDAGRRACNVVGRQGHGASPVGGGPSTKWASRAAVATLAGGPAMTSAASATAPLP